MGNPFRCASGSPVNWPTHLAGSKPWNCTKHRPLALEALSLYRWDMYKIVGTDQKEYGPVTSDQVREWIAQGRAGAHTLASFEGSPWKPLSTFPEFADALRTAAPPTLAQTAYPGQSYVTPRSNTPAVTGLVLAVLGTCCLPLSLAGLVLCAIGWSQIKKNPEAYTTSTIIPIIGIVIALLDFVLVIVAYSSGAFDDLMRNLPR
jgi:hypothetical protein